MTHHLVDYCDRTIQTVVTKNAAIAEDWIKNIKKLQLLKQNGEICSRIVVGVSCKFIHHPIKSMSKRAALLQLCVGTSCLILQLTHIDCVSQSLKEQLQGDHQSSFVFAGVEIEEIFKKLGNEYGLYLGGRKLDLHLMAKNWFPMSYRGRPSLKTLAYGIAGLSMRKSNRYKGNWESNVLDDELVERACCDAYASYCIAQEMLRENGH